MRLVWEVFDPDRIPVGLIEQATGKIIARYNAVGSWSVTVRAGALPSEVRAVVEEPGSGIRVTDADRPANDPIIAGPMTRPALAWGDGGDRGTLTLSGVSWEQVLADRITYPNPSLPWTSQVIGTVDRRPAGTGTAAAETVVRGYIDDNAGPSALAARQTPGLAMEPDLARGTALAGRSACENLLDLVQRLCGVGGLRVHIVHEPDGVLVCRFVEPVTRADVLLSADSGSARAGTHSVEAPTCSRALIAGETVLVEVSDSARETLWHRRIEQVIDQTSSDDLDEINESGEEALLDGRATDALAATVTDTPDAVYGLDYQLGDVVPYEARVLGAGTIIEQPIREVEIEARVGQVTVTPVVGAEGATGTKATFRRTAKLAKKVRRNAQPWF